MKEKLEILEKEIRKALLRLMEIREGCYFIDKTFGNEKVKLLHRCQRDDIEYILDEDGVVCWHKCYDKEIIGHDILLSDVLEWFDKLYETNITFYQDVMFQTEKGFLEIWRGDKILAKWNLSKPYLKDQSEELIEFLFNLIEK